MNPKHARFVAEYLKDLNATQAAIRSGYSTKTAGAQGSRLLTNAEIASAVQAATATQVQTAELSATRILEEYRRLALVDLRSFFDADGNLKPIHELTAEQGACVASVEVVKKNLAAGDGKVDVVHKLKVWDKGRALTDLAKYFNLLVEKVEVSGTVDLVESRLVGARRRLATGAP